uniref:Hirustasin-like factor 4 n=1 Tax=Hirudo verbana TaxID=311461 RepID=A0A7T0KCZ5_9ANNE|nr:hirustasin-like factor 4 [Hirudo verbana]
MKTAIFCCLFLAFVLVVRAVTHKLCGDTKCSPAQDCQDDKCVCSPIRCMILCPNGFKVDENGCEYPCTCA